MRSNVRVDLPCYILNLGVVMYLIERYWFDPMKNRNADGWEAIGVVRDTEEAKRIVALKQYEVAENKWPLRYAVGEGELYAPAFRYKPFTELTGKTLKELEEI